MPIALLTQPELSMEAAISQPAASSDASAGAAPHRGPRPSPDGGVRGARGLPGARGVAQPRSAGGARGPRLGRRGRGRGRVRRRARDHGAADREPHRPAQEGQDREHPRGRRDPLAGGRRDARRPHRHLRLLRAHAGLGPDARALPPARGRHPGVPPTGSRASSSARTATSCSARRSCTTSASSS